MLGKAWGAVLEGAEARLVVVEVDLAGGLPAIAAVGLPDSAVREGIDRIRAALRNGGFRLPTRRITLNLAPAGTRKTGTALDLPIALAILAADGQVPAPSADGSVYVGELGLDGSTRPVRGALPMALAASESGHRRIVVPAENATEAALVAGIACFSASTLAHAVRFTGGRAGGDPVCVDGAALLRDARQAAEPARDLREVRGQLLARRALEISAAGGHHLLLSGPPGCGKTMLAERLPGILPELTLKEALDVTRVWSAAGLASGLVGRRPFRAPHHGVTQAGLVGGGAPVRAGEAALASGGVLFLDELPEFRREVLESLRQPLESRRISVRRVRGTVHFPARFTLVASMNPCPCGHHGHPDGRCRCSPREVHRYLSRLSGPLLDRFDLVVRLQPVGWVDSEREAPGEGSLAVRERVVAARRIQSDRFGSAGIECNARMGPAELDRFVPLTGPARALLRQATARLGLSARGHDAIRKVARTLADLGGAPRVDDGHLAEAVLYRPPTEDAAGRRDLLPGGVPRTQ